MKKYKVKKFTWYLLYLVFTGAYLLNVFHIFNKKEIDAILITLFIINLICGAMILLSKLLNIDYTTLLAARVLIAMISVIVTFLPISSLIIFYIITGLQIVDSIQASLLPIFFGEVS